MYNLNLINIMHVSSMVIKLSSESVPKYQSSMKWLWYNWNDITQWSNTGQLWQCIPSHALHVPCQIVAHLESAAYHKMDKDIFEPTVFFNDENINMANDPDKSCTRHCKLVGELL